MNKYMLRPAEITNIWGKHINNMESPGITNDTFSMIPHLFYEFNGDPSVLMIYAGPVHAEGKLNFVYTPIDILRNYLLKHVKSDTKVCFDNLYEGTIGFELDTIYRAIKGTHIRPSQIFYFSCALDSDKLFDDYSKLNMPAEKINLYSCITWECVLVRASRQFVVDYKIKPKKKNFLCFNRILREHRLALFSLLASHGLLDQCFYSFFTDAYYTEGASGKLNNLSKYLSTGTYKKIAESYNSHKHLLPLKLNIESSENRNTIKADDLELFDESYLSIVTETFFFPQKHPRGMVDFNSVFFSEKIYKPILMKHPFILVSRPDSLRYLRKLGYKTFEPFINETYDTIADDELRLLAIVTELERLNKFTDDQWIEWQTNVESIVEHNHFIMTNRKQHEYAFKRPDYETKY